MTRKMYTGINNKRRPVSLVILLFGLVVSFAIFFSSYEPEYQPLHVENVYAACELRIQGPHVSGTANPSTADTSVTISVDGALSVTLGATCSGPGTFCNELSDIATQSSPANTVKTINCAGPESCLTSQFFGPDIPISINVVDNTTNSCTAGSNSSFSGSRVYDVSDLDEGSYTLTVEIVDNLGRRKEGDINFTIDHPPTPVVLKTFTVSKNIAAGGTLTSLAPNTGINCGATCSKQFDSTLSVTVRAAENTGYTFLNWNNVSGCGSQCTKSNKDVTCPMNVDRSCRADFATHCADGIDNDGDGFIDLADPGCSGSGGTSETNIWRMLTVAKNIAAGGTVTGPNGKPGNGISCGSNCSEEYNNGTNVTITAGVNAGYQFNNWSGSSGCTGTNPALNITMNAAKTCTANYSLIPPSQHLLTVTKSGSGTVTSSPAGINCGGDCTEAYNQGTVVTLNQTPAAGWQFDSWSGDADCSDGMLTMSAARNCTANWILTSTVGTVEVTSNVATTWDWTAKPAGGPADQSTPLASRTYNSQPTGSYTIAPADLDSRPCPAGYLCPPSISPASSQTLNSGATITFTLDYTVDPGGPGNGGPTVAPTCSPKTYNNLKVDVTGNFAGSDDDSPNCDTCTWSAPGATPPTTGSDPTFNASYPTAGPYTVTVTNSVDQDTCSVTVVDAICGDAVCDPGESCGGSCPQDCNCGAAPLVECNNGIDDDADGRVDCSTSGLGPDPGCFPDGNGGGGACDTGDDSEDSDNPSSIDEI